MGGCASTSSNPHEDANNKDIETYLNNSKIQQMLDLKILLLGAGESGKSTVVKQLKTLHKVQMDEAELASFAINIHKNTVQSMQTILEASDTLQIPIEGIEARRRADNVKGFAFDVDQKRMPVSIGEDIEYLWKDPSIQQVWSRRSEYWFLDATPYYFENIPRFLEDIYTPTEEDCIMTRVRTTGIAVTELNEGPVHFKIVDVGGQRNERKKWIHCFDDVKALLFVVNLAGYDQVMFEDPTQNRMKESLNLFGQIVNNPVFQSTPIFLCFNKKDIFESMLQTVGLNKCFPEYTGGADVQAAMAFVQKIYQEQVNDRRVVNVYFIAARFKKDVRYAWDEVKQILLEDNKRQVAHATKATSATKKK